MKFCFLAVFLSAAVASGGLITVTDPTVRIYQSGAGFDPFGTVTISVFGQNSGDSTLDATACYSGFCPGEAAPGAGPDFFVNNPLAVKLTNITYTCLTDSPCATSIAAFFTWSDASAGKPVPVTL